MLPYNESRPYMRRERHARGGRGGANTEIATGRQRPPLAMTTGDGGRTAAAGGVARGGREVRGAGRAPGSNGERGGAVAEVVLRIEQLEGAWDLPQPPDLRYPQSRISPSTRTGGAKRWDRGSGRCCVF